MLKLRTLLWTTCGIILATAFIGGAAYLSHLEQQIKIETSPTEKLSLGGDFTLTNQDGHAWSSASTLGKIRLVYFGYSFCPDICPMALHAISDALDSLGPKSHDIVPIFVTIDPQRDTVQTLKKYSKTFHPSFVFCTGSTKDIDHIAKLFKVYANRVHVPGTKADYLIDHSSLIYVIGRHGDYITSFAHTTSPEIIASTLKKMLGQK